MGGENRKIVRRNRSLVAVLAALCLAPLSNWTQIAEAEPQRRLQREEITPQRLMIRRDAIGYKNYAVNHFTNYANHTIPISPRLADNYHPRGFYGPLGNEQITGFEFLNWQELRQPGLSCEDRRGAVCGSNYIQRDGGVIVANDGYGDWGYRALAGSTGRLHLSPLTVSFANQSGLRIDLLTPKAQFTGYARRWGHNRKRGSQLLLANRAQTVIGGLTLALNWASYHRYISTLPGNNLKGRLDRETKIPDWIIVRVRDDSPDDGHSGPIVQDLQLVVNGEKRPDLVPYVIRHRTAEATQIGRISRETGSFRPTRYIDGAHNPLHADYLYRIAHERGEDVSDRTNLPGLLKSFPLVSNIHTVQFDRDEQVVFVFDLSAEPSVISTAVEALAGNDYEFSWSTVRTINERNRNYVQRYDARSYYPVRRALADVQDNSNFGRIRFQIGDFTGNFFYSAEMSLVMLGFEMHAEYARSSQYFRYPAHVGREKTLDDSPRFSKPGDAYFANLVRWFGHGRFGAELFKIHPNFISLVDDNEDGDAYADGWDNDGVYLGQDVDRDGYPDTNRDGDPFPDYIEPFLMFDVEPSEFSYGLDRNNNDEPDFREDDRERDYPYNWDERGYHFFGQLDLSPHWSLAVGHYRAEEIAGAGKSETNYALLTYQREGVDRLRTLFFENNLRKVKDDIPDRYYVIAEERRFSSIYQRYSVHTAMTYGARGFRPTSRKDPLSYRDSYVNESYLEARLQPLSGLSLVQKLRLRLNWQRKSQLAGARARGRLDYWTSVHSINYTWNCGRFTLEPKFKFLALRLTNQGSGRFIRSEYDTIPIVQASFQLMKRTTFRFALQGWGPLPYRFDDRARRLESFERRTTISSLTMRSTYFGYDLVTITGLEKDHLRYSSRVRKADNFHTVSFFVRALVGFSEYGRLI